MRSRVYRCYACHNEAGVFGREFVVSLEDSAPLVKLPNGESGPAVACPNCKLSNTHATYGGNVVPVLLIHYEPPLTPAMRGRAGVGHIACDRAKLVAADDELRYSGEPLAVNCPLCIQSAEYKAVTTGQLHPSFDIPLKPAKGGGPAVPEIDPYTPPAKKE